MTRELFFLPVTALLICNFLMSCSHGGSDSGSSSETVAEVVETSVASTAELVEQMHVSALDGDISSVKEALDAGVDVNAVDADGHTALMLAAYNGHSEIVLTLLDRGAGIDRRDMEGRTALLYAATGPFPETVTILLDKGAVPNVVDSGEHFSPLMHAAAEGHLSVVKILIEAGSNPTLKDVDGDDAASFARQAGHDEVANYLDSLY